MEIGLGILLTSLGGLCAAGAWMHQDRLEGKEDIIRCKDETIRAKDTEIDSLRRKIQSPSDLQIEVQVIKASSEAQLDHLRRQLSQISESEQARRLEIEDRLKQEQAHRARIGDLAAKLAEQVIARTRLEVEVVALRSQISPISNRLPEGSSRGDAPGLSLSSEGGQATPAEPSTREGRTPKELREGP